MHIVLPLSKETVLMGSDANQMYGEVNTGQNISLSVNTESKEEVDRVFIKTLSEGGKITMPLGNTFWNAYFGMVIDKFGFTWMINFDYATEKKA